MKYMGIDYGTKRIGIAISDESGKFAFPKVIVSSGKQALVDIVNLIQSEQVGQVILLEIQLMPWEIEMRLWRILMCLLSSFAKLTGLPIGFMDERFSSTAVRSFDFEKPIANTRGNARPTDHIDDRAAAVMLQRYLDKLHP
jgi:putative Holliday junction resolvase